MSQTVGPLSRCGGGWRKPGSMGLTTWCALRAAVLCCAVLCCADVNRSLAGQIQHCPTQHANICTCMFISHAQQAAAQVADPGMQMISHAAATCLRCCAEQVIFVAATKADNPTRKVTEKEGRDWAAAQVSR